MKHTLTLLALTAVLALSCNEKQQSTNHLPENEYTQQDYTPKYYIVGYVFTHKKDNGITYGSAGRVDSFPTREHIYKMNSDEYKNNIDEITIISISEVRKDMYYSVFDTLKLK